MLPVAAVFLGELAALNALAFGDQGAVQFAAVSSSLVVSAVALILAVMADMAPFPGAGMQGTPASPAPTRSMAGESEPPVPPATPREGDRPG